MKVVGVDLAGKQENATGFCLLITPGKEAPLGRTMTRLLSTDAEIMREIEDAKPDCIAIDAPFWLPPDIGGKMQPWRNSELMLMKRGYRPISTALPTMKILALRAMKIVRELRDKGYRAIEVFPAATENILGISKQPRKNQDEYDALLCALTAKMYMDGRYEDLGGIIIPK
ncbi:MAG: DUF429 domain-containing protein [Candidatus Aenigmatarchaeota archaeon]